MSQTLWNRLPGDPKVKNLIYFVITRTLGLAAILYVIYTYSGETDFLRIFGLLTISILLWRILLSIWRHRCSPPKSLHSYGRWCVITGSTSGIGAEFADEIASQGLNLLLISRSVSKLQEQSNELKEKYKNINCKYIAYDFTKTGTVREVFYKELDKHLTEMSKDDEKEGGGGVGALINNVGTANEFPRSLEEFSDAEIEDMIQCNIFSQVFMTRAVTKFMRLKKKGCVISISSGSGNHVGPFLAVYSATKSFMTQFSRSLSIESWNSGIDYLVVTPFYVVSNLYKRKSGTIIAPMPSALVKGTLQNIGKPWLWQTHGYWFHAWIGMFATYWWGMTKRYMKMMKDNRKRYDEREMAKNSSSSITSSSSSSSSSSSGVKEKSK